MASPRHRSRTAAPAAVEFNVIAELGDVAEAAMLEDDDWTGAALAALVGYGPAMSRSPYGRLEVIVTLPATDLAQATRTAMAVLADVRRSDGSPMPVFSIEVLPTPAFDHRARYVHVPPLVSVPEAARALGISRQAVLKRIEAGTLPASRIGSVWAVSAAAMPFPFDDDWPHGASIDKGADTDADLASKASRSTSASSAGVTA